MADVPVPSIVTATPADADSVLGVQGGVVKRFLIGALKSFTQAGTGAVSRNLQDKAREIVSAQDFGAVGDGVADDTLALQRFLDAGGGLLKATGAFYLVSDALTMPSGCVISGVGGMPIIKLKAATNKTLLSATSKSNIRIQNLELDANEGQQAKAEYYGLLFSQCTNITLDNVYSHDSVYPNVRFLDCDGMDVTNLRCATSPAEGLKVSGSSNGVFRNIILSNYPKSATHTPIGAVAAVQVDDGSNHIRFENVKITNDAASAGVGIDFSTHAGEPITHSITVNGLYTEKTDCGFRVTNASENITLLNHKSVDERRCAMIDKNSKRVRIDGFDYYMGDVVTFAGSRYPISFEQGADSVSIRNGVVNGKGTGIYVGASVTSFTNVVFDNVEVTSRDASAVWVRGAASVTDLDISFTDCELRSSGTGALVLLGVAAVTGFSRQNFDRCKMYVSPSTSQIGVVMNYMQNVSFTDSFFSCQNKAAVACEVGSGNCVIRGGRIIGTGTGTAILVKAGVSGVAVRGAEISTFTRLLQLAPGDAVTKTVNITFDGCTIKSISQGAFYITGTLDARYVDRLTINDNVFIDVPTLFTGFPLGTNGTNLVALGNNPAVTIP